jgi:hypothetical protein
VENCVLASAQCCPPSFPRFSTLVPGHLSDNPLSARILQPSIARPPSILVSSVCLHDNPGPHSLTLCKHSGSWCRREGRSPWPDPTGHGARKISKTLRAGLGSSPPYRVAPPSQPSSLPLIGLLPPPRRCSLATYSAANERLTMLLLPVWLSWIRRCPPKEH